MFSPGPAPRPRSTDPDVLTACGNSSRSASRRRLPNLDHLPLSPAAPVSRSLAHPRLRTFNQVGGRQTTVQTRRQSCPNPGRMHGSRRNRKHESKWTGPQKSSRRPTATEDKSPAGEKRIPRPRLCLSLHRGSYAKNLFLDGSAQVLGEEVRLFERFPACDGLLRSLDGDLPERACWNSCPVGETAHLVWGDLREAAAVAETQAEIVVKNIRQRGDKIVARRQDGRAAVGIKEGPVLEMHVGVADQHGEYETADEFEYGVFANFRPEDSGNVRVAVPFILVVGKFPKDLCEIFHVNGLATRQSVEPLHGQRPAFHCMRLFGQSFDARYIYELVFRDGDADPAGQFHHGEFILGNRLVAGRRQLDNPRSAHPVHRNGQAARGLHDGREFQLHSRERKAQRFFAVALAVLIVMVMMSFLPPRLTLKRCNDKRAGKVGAEHGEEEEFAIGIDARALGEIVAQGTFGEKIREVRWYAARRGARLCHEPASAALEGEAQSRTLLVIYILLLECKKLAVAREAGDDADVLFV